MECLAFPTVSLFGLFSTKVGRFLNILARSVHEDGFSYFAWSGYDVDYVHVRCGG